MNGVEVLDLGTLSFMATSVILLEHRSVALIDGFLEFIKTSDSEPRTLELILQAIFSESIPVTTFFDLLLVLRESRADFPQFDFPLPRFDSLTKNKLFPYFQELFGGNARAADPQKSLQALDFLLRSLRNLIFRNNKIVSVLSEENQAVAFVLRDSDVFSLLYPTSSINGLRHSLCLQQLNMGIDVNTEGPLEPSGDFDHGVELSEESPWISSCSLLRYFVGLTSTRNSSFAWSTLVFEILNRKILSDHDGETLSYKNIVKKKCDEVSSLVDMSRIGFLLSKVLPRSDSLASSLLQVLEAVSSAPDKDLQSINFYKDGYQQISFSSIQVLFHEISEFLQSRISLQVIILSLVTTLLKLNLPSSHRFLEVQQKAKRDFLKTVDQSLFIIHVFGSLFEFRTIQGGSRGSQSGLYLDSFSRLFVGEDLLINMFQRGVIEKISLANSAATSDVVRARTLSVLSYLEVSPTKNIDFELFNICEYLGFKVV